MAKLLSACFEIAGTSGLVYAKIVEISPFLVFIVLPCLVLSRPRDPMLTIDHVLSCIVWSRLVVAGEYRRLYAQGNKIEEKEERKQVARAEE